MALWIIAIVLIIVFFPILFGVATTAAMIIIPLGILAFSVGSVIYFAGAAVANPKLGRLVGIGITIFHIFFQLSPVLRWVYAHKNGRGFYSLTPILTAYAVCLLMLARNRGMGGRKGIYGIILLLLGAGFQTGIKIITSSFYFTPTQILFPLFSILGYALLLAVPAHSETLAEEKNGVLLITCGFLADEVCEVLRLLISALITAGVPVTTPIMRVIGYGSFLLITAGAVLYIKSMLSGGKNKEN